MTTLVYTLTDKETGEVKKIGVHTIYVPQTQDFNIAGEFKSFYDAGDLANKLKKEHNLIPVKSVRSHKITTSGTKVRRVKVS